MRRLATVFLLFCLATAAAPAHELSSPTGGEPAARAAAVLDLNSATVEQLDELPGIGPALAGRIVDYRTAHGPFKEIDQLNEVKGIGARTLEKLRPLLVLN